MASESLTKSRRCAGRGPRVRGRLGSPSQPLLGKALDRTKVLGGALPKAQKSLKQSKNVVLTTDPACLDDRLGFSRRPAKLNRRFPFVVGARGGMSVSVTILSARDVVDRSITRSRRGVGRFDANLNAQRRQVSKLKQSRV